MSTRWVNRNAVGLSMVLLGLSALIAMAGEPRKINTSWKNPDGSEFATTVTLTLTEMDYGEWAISGSYDFAGGRIQGICRGKPVSCTGYWYQDGQADKCPKPRNGTSYHGSLSWTPHKTGFDGKWGICDDPPTFEWKGRQAE